MFSWQEQYLTSELRFANLFYECSGRFHVFSRRQNGKTFETIYSKTKRQLHHPTQSKRYKGQSVTCNAMSRARVLARTSSPSCSTARLGGEHYFALSSKHSLTTGRV